MKEKELKKKEEALKKEERKLAREKKAKDRREALEKKACEQEETRRKANARQITRPRSQVPEVPDSFLADSFVCPLLDLAPPFENSCTLPSPFSSAQPSPIPSVILGLASDIQENQNSMAVAPDTEIEEQIINAATDRAVESPVNLKKPNGLLRKGSIFISFRCTYTLQIYV